jgi:hypothetical protein
MGLRDYNIGPTKDINTQHLYNLHCMHTEYFAPICICYEFSLRSHPNLHFFPHTHTGGVQGLILSPLLLLKTRVMTDPAMRNAGNGIFDSAMASTKGIVHTLECILGCFNLDFSLSFFNFCLC